MATNEFRTWYEAALIQSVADSYLDSTSLASINQGLNVAPLLSGNNDLRQTVLVNGVPTPNQLFEAGSPYANAGPTTDILPGATRMTPLQVEYFLSRFEIVHHAANDSGGFSAILVRDRSSGEFSLSFRSTEFLKQVLGGDRERDFPAGVNIAAHGYAFAQVSAMERYYEQLRADINPATGQPYLPAGSTLNVVGYSLGGHLATVFTETHVAEINRSYLFNAAGRGGLPAGWDEARLLDTYQRLLANPLAPVGIAAAGNPNLATLRAVAMASAPVAAGDPNIYNHARYRWALAVLGSVTTGNFSLSVGLRIPRPINSLAAAKMTFLQGMGAHNDDSAVAGAGVIPEQQRRLVFIEDQPNFYGPSAGFEIPGMDGHWYNGDFYRTHSITLIEDSLAVMDVFKQASQGLTQLEIESILAATSNEYGDGARDVSKVKVEGASLESAVDALYRIVKPTSPFAPLDVSRAPDGFGHLANRDAFYARIEELGEAIQAAGTSPYTIRALVSMTWEPQTGIPFRLSSAQTVLDRVDTVTIKARAAADTDEGLAYRYALREQIPFVVIGAPYTAADREALKLFDPATGAGNMTARWIEDRTEMLRVHLSRNIEDKAYLPSTEANSIVHRDLRTGVSAYALSADAAKLVDKERAALNNQDIAAAQAFTRDERKDRARYVVFGAYGDATKDPSTKEGGRDEIAGGMLNDRLYGGGGNDLLRGGDGKDHLQGDAGDDRLIGGSGDDTLLGGKGNDIVNGGAGTDKYYFYTGGGVDEVFDVAEGPTGAKRQLGEIYFGGASGDVRITGTFTALDPDRKNFRLELGAETYFAAYLGDLNTATPGKLTLFKGSDGSNVVTLNNFISGDFGIVLDPNAPARQYTEKFGTAEAENSNLINIPHQSSLASDAAEQKVFGLEGADFITVSHANAQGIGGADNDYLTNGANDQQLYGEAGRDVLVATAGDDSLYGGIQDDALQGGADKDYLEGNEGSDVLDGGAGEDVIAGGDGHDFIFGGGSVTVAIGDWNAFADGSFDWGAFDAAGNVLIRGLQGRSNVDGDAADVITGGAGNDWVFAGDGNDAVAGGLDNDYLVGQAGNDAISADEGDDTLYGDGAQGDLSQAPGNFSVFTFPQFHGKDVLDGGAGNDFVSGDGEADELYGGDGNDTLIGDSNNVSEQFHGADYLDGGDGNDVLLGYGKDDTLFGGAGEDNLGGDSSSIAGSLHGDDYLDGEDGADTLHGDGGADTLFGGAGNDILDGDASNVAFEFHGDDYLEGEEGDDALQGGGGSDRLFGGIGNDSLNGDVAGLPAEFAGDDYLDGEAGDDVLEAGAGNDTLAGGSGSDILRGQAGDDLYLVNVGDASDFILDREGANTVRFGAGIASNPFVFQQLGSDGKAYLGLRYSGSETLFIEDGLTNSALRYEFADGKVKTAADWRTSFSQFIFTSGGSGADTMTGNALAQLFVPGGGNDTINFGRGSGFDKVSGFGQITGAVEGLDKIQVGTGITMSDLEMTRSTTSLVLTIRDTGDRLQIDNWLGDAPNAHTGVQVQFADGAGLTASQLVALSLNSTQGDDLLLGGASGEAISGGAGNDNLQGGDGADTLDGGTGNDSLSGGSGADVYLFGAGDGNDVITDTSTDANVVQFKPGITPADVTLTQGSIVVTLNATGETLTFANWHGDDGGGSIDLVTAAQVPVSELRFSDGTVWDASLINEHANHASPFADRLRGIFTADTLHGLSGDDDLRGFAGDDVLAGGDGNDVLTGGLGADELNGGARNDSLNGTGGGDVLDGGAGDDKVGLPLPAWAIGLPRAGAFGAAPRRRVARRGRSCVDRPRRVGHSSSDRLRPRLQSGAGRAPSRSSEARFGVTLCEERH